MPAIETHAPLSSPQLQSRASSSLASSWLMTGANLEPQFGGISAVVASLGESVQAASDCRISLASFEDVSSGDASSGDASSGDASSGDAVGTPADEVPGLTRSHFPLRNAAWLNPRPWQSLEQEIRAADGVHIHGIWQKHCAVSAHLARRSGKPYMISAHGMLDGWALGNKRLKKQLYSALVETRNLRKAACLHALTAAEAADYSKIAPNTPVAVIPNGVTVPRATGELFFEKFPHLEGFQIVLFLGRIHYKKGLDVLCLAWAKMFQDFPDARLVLAGPDFEDTRSDIEQLLDQLNIRSRVTFTGMLSGPLKWSALSAASLFVLPSYSEGFSVSVLEALGTGLPVVISAQCNLEEVASRECGWVIQPDAAELEAALRTALTMPDTLRRRMGRNGKELISQKYSWPVVGSRMAAVYQWILGGARPDCILTY